jgi:class 3 adenylate cyclase
MKTPPDSALADAQRIIADLRCQLAARTAERDEAVAQQTATAEVLGVINASPGDLAPVFDAILEKAHILCGAMKGALVTYDGEHFRAVATHGLPAQFDELIRQPRPAYAGSPAQRVLQGERLIHIPDQAADTQTNPISRASVELAGTRTLLFLPLRKDETLLGYITAFRQEVRPFTDKQIALLQNFAAQAVIAMENARLITETREALEQQTATAEVLQVINSSPGDLAPVFDAILEKAHTLCGAAHGSLTVCDGELFHAVATHGQSETFASVLRRPRPASPVHRRLQAGERFVHIADMKTLTVAPSDIVTPAAVEAGIRTQLFVPLRKDGILFGYITARRREVRPFSEKEIALLENFAAQAVMAIENARLIAETREALDQQTATAEVLQVINASPGNLAPVFDAMLEKGLRLCNAAFGSLVSYDGEVFRQVAQRNLPPELAGPDRELRAQEGSLLHRLMQGENLVAVDDIAASSRPSSLGGRATLVAAGARSMLWVALRRENALVGAINIYRNEVQPFSDKQIALLQNFAAQAVIAMENARLLGELRQRTDEVGELNRGLEARVAEQVEELGRVGRLKRFLAPQLAELIVSQGDEKILESHRREIVVVFCDLRGYTAFTETAEPEEVLDLLREYHGALGPLVSQFEGTLDQFSGDGIMVFFNDPVPILNPAERAVKMAVAMREVASALIAAWRERGRELGFGAGIAQGYATLGQIGFSERSGYTAIGTVCNVAARLCAEAKDGQILLSQRVNVALKGSVATEQIGAVALKGLTQPVVAYNVPLAATQPALRVIEGGPQSV